MFASVAEGFRAEFVTGEDQDFFRRAILNGHRFIWCNEAVAFELTPEIRWNLGFMLRRALVRGRISNPPPSPPRQRGEIGRGRATVLPCLALPSSFRLPPFREVPRENVRPYWATRSRFAAEPR